ncbi:MAG: glycosyltransferase family 4 protein [Methanotrichaceae archaeon]
MKILQVTPYFPPHVGGVEYHVKGLADGLIKRGYNVGVASSCGRYSDFVHIPSIDLCYAPLPLKKFPKCKADIYHSHVPSPIFAFMLRKAAPHVVTYHNDVIFPMRLNGFRYPTHLGKSMEWLNGKIIKPVLDEAEIIIATTKSYAETSSVLKNYLHKTRIVPNAIDVSLYPPTDEKENYIVYAGRLVSYKGVETLLDAMKIVQAKEDLRLILIGDGYDKDRLERMAAKMGVIAEFTGRVLHNRFIDLISRAEVLVLPTTNRLEAFGIVLLEAMACKTPVLAYDTPGVNEVAMDGGMVYSSTDELAEKIIELHSNRPLRRSLGQSGRAAVEAKYSWGSVLDKIESIYREVT